MHLYQELAHRVETWRANGFHSDVPERKDDLVAGTYRIPAPQVDTTVAVKIIDMLGEEVLVVSRL